MIYIHCNYYSVNHWINTLIRSKKKKITNPIQVIGEIYLFANVCEHACITVYVGFVCICVCLKRIAIQTRKISSEYSICYTISCSWNRQQAHFHNGTGVEYIFIGRGLNLATPKKVFPVLISASCVLNIVLCTFRVRPWLNHLQKIFGGILFLLLLLLLEYHNCLLSYVSFFMA